MRKYLYKVSLSLVFITLIACSKAEVEVPGPLEKIISMNQDCICEPYIDEYSWHEQIVYVLGNSGPACDSKILYYTELGEEIKMDTGYSHSDFIKESRFVENIWRCR